MFSFRSKLISILHKASLSHRRESLWDKLMISRLENPVATRQEVIYNVYFMYDVV